MAGVVLPYLPVTKPSTVFKTPTYPRFALSISYYSDRLSTTEFFGIQLTLSLLYVFLIGGLSSRSSNLRIFRQSKISCDYSCFEVSVKFNFNTLRDCKYCCSSISSSFEPYDELIVSHIACERPALWGYNQLVFLRVSSTNVVVT